MNWTYEDFKAAVLKLTGIDLSSYKERQMKRRIDSFISRNGYGSYQDFFSALCEDKMKQTHFIDYITINVSEFFRNPEQWDVLDKQILPMLLNKYRDLNIWCAACSTGEEPYSLAMLLSRHMPINRIKILATDIDANALEKAIKGIYNRKNVVNVPEDFVSRFFNAENETLVVKDWIKRCVEFKEHNLLRDPYPKQCHLILCRNVMIYLTENAKSYLYKAFYDSLHPDGVLFVGSTEQIILPQAYRLEPVAAFFYKRLADKRQE